MSDDRLDRIKARLDSVADTDAYVAMRKKDARWLLDALDEARRKAARYRNAFRDQLEDTEGVDPWEVAELAGALPWEETDDE